MHKNKQLLFYGFDIAIVSGHVCLIDITANLWKVTCGGKITGCSFFIVIEERKWSHFNSLNSLVLLNLCDLITMFLAQYTLRIVYCTNCYL